jgi:hypothetical protein
MALRLSCDVNKLIMNYKVHYFKLKLLIFTLVTDSVAKLYYVHHTLDASTNASCKNRKSLSFHSLYIQKVLLTVSVRSAITQFQVTIETNC